MDVIDGEDEPDVYSLHISRIGEVYMHLFLCCPSALPSPSSQSFCQKKFNPIGGQKILKATLKVIKLENNPWLVNEWMKAGKRNGGGRGNVDFISVYRHFHFISFQGFEFRKCSPEEWQSLKKMDLLCHSMCSMHGLLHVSRSHTKDRKHLAPCSNAHQLLSSEIQ